MELSTDIIDEVLRVYRKTRQSPFKTSRLTGITVDKVFQIVDDNRDKLAEALERHGGLGRPELQDYTVARRRVTERGWDNKDEAIAQARLDYENGTHEMATGRDGTWLILYSIPRSKKIKGREGYFKPEVG